MGRPPLVSLTWAGFDAAVDLIAAQCRRDLTGVCGMDRGGELLAWALADRLGLEVTERPRAGGLLVYGVLDRPPRYLRVEIAELWSWVQVCPVGSGVMTASRGTQVLMPWQDAPASCIRPFVDGFDD
ncbi:MAG: hypothetical protein RLZZ533_1069 [Cyanobacteriota bacterium]